MWIAKMNILVKQPSLRHPVPIISRSGTIIAQVNPYSACRSCFLTVMAGLILALLVHVQSAVAAFDWQAGPWGIVIATNGSAGSVSCPMDYPGGTKTGNALAVHYEFTPTNLPQLWVFLTDGFWRQTSPESEFLTSYRLFRYFSSGNQDCDRLAAVGFNVLGTNELGELQIETVYSNNAASGDRFRVTGRIVLENPDPLQSALRAEIVISNASGRAVTSFDDPLHRALAQQWELFGVSSMYVADNLTGGLPAWYDGLDPSRHYVGATNDDSYLNDGYSVNGATNVSTHDVKFIVASNTTVALAHDTNVCPVVVVPSYEWYDQLVMRGLVSSDLRVQHAYRSARNHHIEILGCSGLTSNRDDLKWAATYKRDDTNMVDGDNIQITLGLDDVLDIWPADAVQTLDVRLSTGNTRPTITAFAITNASEATIGWTTEPGELYALQHVAILDGVWSNVTDNVAGPVWGPLPVPAGFLRVGEASGF